MNTVSIIHTGTNNIFGAYLSIPFIKDGTWKKDDKSFIYFIRSSNKYKSQIFPLKYTESLELYCYGSYIFLYGYETIWIYAHCNSKSTSYTKATDSYGIPTSHYLNGGKKSFTVLDIEVFTLSMNALN